MMKTYTVTITLEEIELAALIGEYTAKGLYGTWPGHNPSPKENVVKKLVEAARASQRKEQSNGAKA
jgi:hypothetical protein